MSEKKTDEVTLVGVAIIILLITGILVAIWAVASKKETYVTEDSQDVVRTSLHCEASHVEGAFFVSSVVQNYQHELKLIFRSGDLDDVSYRYEGVYNSDSMAEAAMAEMHTRYNKYMGRYAENFNPVFSAVGTKARVSIYAEKGKINSVVAPIFFMNVEEFAKLDEYKIEDFEKLYESKGFSCVFHE